MEWEVEMEPDLEPQPDSEPQPEVDMEWRAQAIVERHDSSGAQ
jgi:hypothetical protein